MSTSRHLRRVREFVRGEATLLVSIVLMCGLVWGFFQIADGVVEGDTTTFDTVVLGLFRQPGNINALAGPLWVQEMMRDVTAMGSFAVLGILVLGVVLYLLMSNMRAAAVMVLVSVLGGTFLSTVLKMGYNRPRPDLDSLVTHQFTASFPSGHSMLSAVTYLTLGALLARLAPTRRLRLYAIISAVLLTVLVGCSRLYLGVHYPSDVLAGWALGAAWALLCSSIAVVLQRRGSVEAPTETDQPPTATTP